MQNAKKTRPMKSQQAPGRCDPVTNHISAIRQKVARLQAGGKPRVLDLFAGCGGISLGFSAAGFSIAGAVEFDPEAAASHGRNFHGGDAAHSQARDIITMVW